MDNNQRNKEVYDLCKDHYSHFNAYPNECELSNGVVLNFYDIVSILSIEQLNEIEKSA